MADNLVTGPATSKQTPERNSPADGRYGTGLEVAKASLYDGAESVDKDQLLQHLLDGTPLVSMSTGSSCNAERVDDERVCDSEKRLGYATGYTPREPSKGKSTADNGVGCDGGPGKIETIDPGGESEHCEGTRSTHTNVGRKDNTFMETDTSTSHNTVTYLMNLCLIFLGGLMVIVYTWRAHGLEQAHCASMSLIPHMDETFLARNANERNRVVTGTRIDNNGSTEETIYSSVKGITFDVTGVTIWAAADGDSRDEGNLTGVTMWEVMDGDSMTEKNLDRRTVRSTRFKGLSETTGDDVTVYDGDEKIPEYMVSTGHSQDIRTIGTGRKKRINDVELYGRTVWEDHK